MSISICMLHVRSIVLVVLCLLLAGCPAQRQIYIHNESEVTLSSAYLNPKWEIVRIRPGRTKYIFTDIGMDSCFRIVIGESTKAYQLPRDIITTSTGYGERLDIYFEYGQFHFQRREGRWAQLEEMDKCENT